MRIGKLVGDKNGLSAVYMALIMKVQRVAGILNRISKLGSIYGK